MALITRFVDLGDTIYGFGKYNTFCAATFLYTISGFGKYNVWIREIQYGFDYTICGFVKYNLDFRLESGIVDYLLTLDFRLKL